MKYIQYSLANPRKQFIIKSKHLPEGIECSEHLTLEDDYFLTRVTVTKMLPYGDIQVDFKSRKDHPKRTIPEAIGILKTCEHNSIHDTTIIIILSNTLHDWLDGLINTRALETVNLLAEAIIQEEEQKQSRKEKFWD